jgi:hypothetical protein
MTKAFFAAFAILVIVVNVVKLYEDIVHFRKRGWDFKEDKPTKSFDAEYGFETSTGRVPPQLRIFIAYPMIILIAAVTCIAQFIW